MEAINAETCYKIALASTGPLFARLRAPAKTTLFARAPILL
jgi:hypothetical protein